MLTEDRRKQLDSIIQQMVSNQEPDSSIEFVVNDFKNKYSVSEPEQSFAEKTSNVLDAIFGGKKVGEAIGTAIAKKRASPEEKEFIEEGPSKGAVLGSALQSASLFAPVGTVAKGITGGARALGMVRGASALGKVSSGAITGEIFDVATNLQQGKTGRDALTPSLGAALGGAIPAAGTAKNMIVRFGNGQAPRVINSLIKPLAKDFSYGKNPGRAVAEEGIVANDFDGLIEGIRKSRQRVGQEIGALSDELSTQPLLSIRKSLSPIDKAMRIAASQNNQTLLSRLGNVKRAITDVLEPVVDEEGNLGIKSVGSRDLDNVTFKQIRSILGDVGEMTAFTGNPSDDKLVNSALKQVYGKIKQDSVDLARSIDPEKGAQFEKLAEKYGDLHSAEIAAKYRDKIAERQNLISLNPTIAGFGTALITAVATGGATIPAVVAGLSGAALDKLASTPGFKTRLAYLLSKKTQNEANYLFRKIPVLSKFFSLKEGFAPGDILLGDFADDLEKGIANYIRKPQLGLSVDDVSKKSGFTPKQIEIYNGEKTLTTKLLKKLEGRSTVSKQFISDLTNSPDLKQPERDLFRNVLKDEGNTVNVKGFANKVKGELLPLKSFRNPASQYENITLSDDLRGPVANYGEHIYQSPIKTSAKDVHFSSLDSSADGYFAHTRIEDLPKNTNTRRVIEIQSDLFQKGRLEGEIGLQRDNVDLARRVQAGETIPNVDSEDLGTFKKINLKTAEPSLKQREAEIAKLEPYRNTWHERVIREEVKKAAQDGKTKLQFPTGETAMKIEGLGEGHQWYTNESWNKYVDSGEQHFLQSPKPESLKVGQEVVQGFIGNENNWIITDVLGDGKFKAVPKDFLNHKMKIAEQEGSPFKDIVEAGKEWDRMSETFDISGKVDTNNPIYKFYEKEVGRYLKNKYNAQLVEDAQGVKWWEVKIDKKMAKLPIEAFAVAPLALPRKEEKREQKRRE